jgi:predicted transcriptional regulator of viral defense system
MEFERLLDLVGNEPVFETSFLLAGNINPDTVRLQLSRWAKSRRIYQLRRGVYSISPPYQKVKPHPFLVANRLQRASYVSAQSALSYYNMLPDIVNTTISVTAGRSENLQTALGSFEFRHIKPSLLHGYRMIDLGGQEALLATPEKALLDLVYLQPGGETDAYLSELRLQNLDHLDLDFLHIQANLFGKPKLYRAIERIINLSQNVSREYQDL